MGETGPDFEGSAVSKSLVKQGGRPVIGEDFLGEPLTSEEQKQQRKHFGTPHPSRLQKLGLAAGALMAAAGVGGWFLKSGGGNGGGQGAETATMVATSKVTEAPTIEAANIPGTSIPKPLLETPQPKAAETSTFPRATETPKTGPTKAPTEKPKPPEDPIFGKYDRLASKIQSSEISQEDKVKYLAEVEKFRSIERVQGKFMEAFNATKGPDGKTPEYLYYMKQLWPDFGSFKAENQIFVLQNKKYLEGTMRPQLEAVAGDFSPNKFRDIAEKLNTQMQFLNPGGRDIYVGLFVTLDMYPAFENPDLAWKENLNFSGFSEAQIAQFKKVQETLGPIFGDYSILDGDKSEGASSFQTQYSKVVPGEIKVSPSDDGNLFHELGHGTALSQSRGQAGHFSAEDLIGAATYEVKALVDPMYGIQFKSVGFLSRQGVSALTREISEYPVSVLQNNTGNTEKIFKKGSISDFAPDKNGKVMSEADFKKIIGFDWANSKHVDNWKQFIDASGDKLNKLSESSDYYSWVVNFIRSDPARADQLMNWDVAPGSPRASAYATDTGYAMAVRTHFDGIFTISLLNGDSEALKVYQGLSADVQKDYLNFALIIREHAIREQWAYGIQKAMMVKDSKSPFLAYYFQFVPKYRK